MNHFNSTFDLPFVTEIMAERRESVLIQINNLKLVDVKEDNAFFATQLRIKGDVLITPVVFGTPAYRDHNFTRRPVTLQMRCKTLALITTFILYTFRSKATNNYSTTDQCLALATGARIAECFSRRMAIG